MFAPSLNGTATAGDANALVNAGDTFTVDGRTITFASGDAPATAPAGFTKVTAIANTTTGNVYTDANGNATVYLGSTTKASVGDMLTAIDIASGVQSNVAGTLTLNAGRTASTVNGSGALLLKSSTGADLSFSGKADTLKALGLTTSLGAGSVTVSASRTTSAATLGNLITDGSTLNVDGHTISFKNASAPSAANVASGSGVSGNVVTDGNGNSTVYLQSATVADVLKAVDLATGVRTASNSGGTASVTTASGQTNSAVNLSGVLQLSTGMNSDLSITATGNALSVLGLTGATGSASAGADAPVVTRAAQQAAPRSPLAAVIRSAHSRHQRSSVAGAHRSEHQDSVAARRLAARPRRLHLLSPYLHGHQN